MSGVDPHAGAASVGLPAHPLGQLEGGAPQVDGELALRTPGAAAVTVAGRAEANPLPGTPAEREVVVREPQRGHVEAHLREPGEAGRPVQRALAVLSTLPVVRTRVQQRGREPTTNRFVAGSD